MKCPSLHFADDFVVLRVVEVFFDCLSSVQFLLKDAGSKIVVDLNGDVIVIALEEYYQVMFVVCHVWCTLFIIS